MTTTVVKSVTGRYHLKIDGRVVGISKHLPDDWREDYNRNQPRDARGRWTSGGGSRGGSRGGGGLANKRVSQLQEIAQKEGIDIDTLSHKARKSVLAAAIEAKRKGKDIREAGLLKPRKTKGGLRGQAEEKAKEQATKKQTKTKPRNSYEASLPKDQKRKYHSVTNQDEFEGLVYNAMADLPKRSESGGVYIYEVRRQLGESVPRDKFNSWLLKMQADGKVQLAGGSSDEASQLNNQDVVSTKLNGLRFRVEPEDKKAFDRAINNPNLKSKYKNLSKNPVPLDPLGSARGFQKGKKIASQQDFDKDAVEAFKRLDNEFQSEGRVPVYKLREALGDRVSKKDFDNYIFDKFTPTFGNDNSFGAIPLTPQQKAQGIETMLGGRKDYVQLDKR